MARAFKLGQVPAIALRLGSDAAWREEIQQRMAKNIDRVFENESPVKELEQFLLSRSLKD